MYDDIHKYKILTFLSIIFLLTSSVCTANTPHISIMIKALESGLPVERAVVDLHACNLGKYFSDEEGKVLIRSEKLKSCIMYISAPGYISLVRNFSEDELQNNGEWVFYMQRQDKYKSGRIWSSEDHGPISNVEVVIKGKNRDNQYSVFTDGQGQFSLIHNADEAIELKFKHPQFQDLEKIIYFRKEMGTLGSFFMHSLEKAAREKKIIPPPKLSGYASKKFSYKKENPDRPKYIIVLALVKNTSKIEDRFPGVDLKLRVSGSWTKVYVGPYLSEADAHKNLYEYRSRYPNAELGTL